MCGVCFFLIGGELQILKGDTRNPSDMDPVLFKVCLLHQLGLIDEIIENQNVVLIQNQNVVSVPFSSSYQKPKCRKLVCRELHT